MSLSASQRDSLADLVSLGFTRAAAALSQITGRPVALAPPQVKLTGVSEIVAELTALLPGAIAYVDQPFSGPISGNGLLLVERDAAVRLAGILGLQVDNPEDTGTQEALTEVGNILLNACIGIFDRVFGVSVAFSVPTTRLSNVAEMFQRLMAESTDASRALLVQTSVRLSEGAVTAYLVLMPRPVSVERLLSELERWKPGAPS